MNRDFKGIWIPKEIWLNKELKVMEKLFLVEIDSLDCSEEGCFASNEYFANFFELSKNRCSEIIKGLEAKGLITISYKYKTNSKAIEKRIIKVVEKSNRGIRNIDRPIRNIEGGYSEKCEDNNTITNNTNNIKEKKEKKKTNIDMLLEGYTSNTELIETLMDFIKMRKTIKKPMTDKALKLLLNKLNKFASTDDDKKIYMLNESIEHSWQTVYEPKDYNIPKKVRKQSNFDY